MADFLKNAIGFFIQVLPCNIIIFLPFPEGSCRIGRKRLFAAVISATALLSVLLSALLCSDIDPDIAFLADFSMLCALSLMLAAYIYIVRESVIKKVLVFFIIMFYGALQYCIVNALSGFISKFLGISPLSTGHAAYTVQGILLYFATSALMLPFVVMFLSRTIGEYIREIDPHNMRRDMFILMFSTIAFIVMMFGLDLAYYYMEYRLYMMLMVIFAVVLVYQITIYWLILRESVRSRHETEQKRLMELQRLQYEQIADDIESTRRMHHDLHHHYNTLGNMLERGDLDGMKGYLSKLRDEAVMRDSRIYCSNAAVNGLLRYYTGIAEDENIRCDVYAECGEMNIEPSDLTVLLGNAMENAINACRKYHGEPLIEIHIGTVMDSLAIEINNSCTEVCYNDGYGSGEGFLPAKAFRSSRPGGGYGLRSIDNTAQKYGGSARFRFNAERKIFTAQIRLNMNIRL